MIDEDEHVLVRVDPNVPPRFRPADLRVVKAMTGKSMIAMSGGDDDADRLCTLAFVALRRANPTASSKELWDMCEQADVELVAVDAADPTNGDGMTPSPLSVTTGG